MQIAHVVATELIAEEPEPLLEGPGLALPLLGEVFERAGPAAVYLRVGPARGIVPAEVAHVEIGVDPHDVCERIADPPFGRRRDAPFELVGAQAQHQRRELSSLVRVQRRGI